MHVLTGSIPLTLSYITFTFCPAWFDLDLIISIFIPKPSNPSSSSVYFSLPIATDLKSIWARYTGVFPPGHSIHMSSLHSHLFETAICLHISLDYIFISYFCYQNMRARSFAKHQFRAPGLPVYSTHFFIIRFLL